MASKKTWLDKLSEKKEPRIKRIDFDFADIPANSNMFIATPQIIDNYIKKIPKGKNVTVQTMRKDLAIENRADYTCPVTTGIFLRIVAEANFEKFIQANSLKGITPFWRVLEPNSTLSKKLSFGQDFIIYQRNAEKINE
ncbi:MAG: hypothetical protein CUR34_12820 [Sediminibacterium sp.]|nr:MAG: hypothetical protein CUR34_12820 [Sediminibacterium sp.] [Sediminibacterium sp. FEMGT703S]